MNTVPNEKDDPAEPETVLKAEHTLAQARARRLTALQAAEGLWKDRTDISKDGVKAQERLRNEWH
jgi:hypothetical protein